MNAKIIDMTGQKFASITALSVVGKSASRDLKWLFHCECGNQFVANGYYARSGKITTCPDCAKKRVGLASFKHGQTETPEYAIWSDIKTRCYNSKTKAFKDYGERGIIVCDRWLESFDNFVADMGKRPSKNHSIDRKDCNGNYEPTNCRWATNIEQGENRRSNILITRNGVTKHLAAWAREFGVNKSLVYNRINVLKWPFEKALTKGVRHDG